MQPTCATLVEGLEAAVARQPRAGTLRPWLGLASGRLSFGEYYRAVLADDRLPCLTLDTTGACDLTCAGMCYYHPGIPLDRPQADLASFERAILDAHAQLSLRTLILAGKEPFLNPVRLFELVAFAGSIPGRQFSIGAITNGRHIERHWAPLAEAVRRGWLDALDISIDSGFAGQHDRIRGREGTFDLACGALRRLNAEMDGLRVGVSSVLRCDNGPGLLELLRVTAPFNRHYWILPIQPAPESSTPAPSADTVVSFLGDLERLLMGELAGSGIEVTVSLHGIYLWDVAERGLIEWSRLWEDEAGLCWAAREFAGNRVVYTCTALPEFGSRIGRVTYDGFYLGHAHFLQDPDPRRFATGSITEEPIVNLYRKAKAPDSYFHRALLSRTSHQCVGRPCWESCFGGWTVSENSFLAGRPLTGQPTVCRKGEHFPILR